jgi:hypothetical protein
MGIWRQSKSRIFGARTYKENEENYTTRGFNLHLIFFGGLNHEG